MNKKKKEKLFSVTKDDCEWSCFHGQGAGGQKRNKTANGVRVYHPPSGARGQAQDTRSLEQNKRLAFERMAKSEEMQKWLRLEVARVTGKLIEVEEAVERAMRPSNLLVEVKQNGKWVQWKDDTDQNPGA